MAERYTEKQGQYLAFIYYYTKIHGVAPAEAEMQRYFGVTPPAVHQMVLSLERKGMGNRRGLPLRLMGARISMGRMENRQAQRGLWDGRAVDRMRSPR
jgi:Mn-dependent DtxR family transcriptional regulator